MRGSCLSRQAFTLLELLLVLALMVAALAVALPNLRGSFSDQRLQKAAEQIRAEWTRARVRAIKTGQIQVFRHSLYSRNYVTTPVASWEDELEASPWVAYSPLGVGGTTSGMPYGQDPSLQNPLRQSPLRSNSSSRNPAGSSLTSADPSGGDPRTFHPTVPAGTKRGPRRPARPPRETLRNPSGQSVGWLNRRR